MSLNNYHFNFNYIYINSRNFNESMDSYYPICIRDLSRCKNIHVAYFPLYHLPMPVRLIYAFHNSVAVNNVVNLPWKDFWYPFYFKSPFPNDERLCLVIADHRFPLEYFRYLRKTYPKARIVKIHRDLISNFKRWFPELTEDVVSEIFDLSLTYDEGDSVKYGYPWFCEFESKLHDLRPSSNYCKYDVFFAGVVKDRLPKLMEVYNKLTLAGYKVHYYLLGVPKEQRIFYEGVEYGDSYLTYREMLQRSIDAKCLLDINQENSVGYTSRFLEAVMYNKILITDNFSVQKHCMYNSDYIQCFKTVDDIDTSILAQNIDNVDYRYTDEFSPINMIKIIDNELTKRFLR